MKKIADEWKKSENRRTRKIMLLEMFLFLSYIICTGIQNFSESEIEKMMYLLRWAILAAAVLLWWLYDRKGK